MGNGVASPGSVKIPTLRTVLEEAGRALDGRPEGVLPPP